MKFNKRSIINTYYGVRIVFLTGLLITIGFFGLMYALQYIILATQNN